MFKIIKSLLLSFFISKDLIALDDSIIREGFLFEKAPFKSCHASTIVETINGDLLCAYFGGDKEGAKNVGIYLSRFSNQKWSKPILIAKDEYQRPCWNPVLYTFPDGECLLFYKVGPSPATWSGVLMRSFDNGHTWNKKENLPAGIFGPIKNKPILKDEALICGSSVESYQRWGCYCEITYDRGKTWIKSAPINLKDDYFGIIQPTILPIDDSKLLLLARTKASGFIATAKSLDSGVTWTNVKLTSLLNPNSGIDATRLKDGSLLLVYNNSKTERFPLNLAVSHDNGKNWEDVLILENDDGEFSYPAIIQTSDNFVVITYTWNRCRIKEVVINLSLLKTKQNFNLENLNIF
jgi:predicted neuraminidase